MSNGAPEAILQPGAGSSDDPGESRRGFPLRPIILFVAAWLGGSWLVVGTWISPVVPGGWAVAAAGLAAGALAVWTLIRGIRGATYPSATTRLLVLRPFWYAMLFMPLLATATVVGAVAGLPFGASGLVGRAALGVAAALLAGAALVGYAGTRRLVVKRLEVRMPRLPAAFDGSRVVQISDLHVGPHTSGRFLERVAETVEKENPDLIAVTGDQVDDFARDAERFVAAFGDLEAPLGVFAIPGNHDVYAGWNGVHRGLSEAGIDVLVNRAVPVECGGQRIWVAGTGDPAGESRLARDRGAAPDIDRTLAGIPSDEPVLALAHNPALWPTLASRGVDLTLSGHTHYGQFTIPSRNWSMASTFLKLAMGSHRTGRSLLYINPGTNYWGIPFRIGTPPEVTVLTLRTAKHDDASISEQDR